jgi:hypothetical protein
MSSVAAFLQGKEFEIIKYYYNENPGNKTPTTKADCATCDFNCSDFLPPLTC